jgi:hypothetical protein
MPSDGATGAKQEKVGGNRRATSHVAPVADIRIRTAARRTTARHGQSAVAQPKKPEVVEPPEHRIVPTGSSPTRQRSGRATGREAETNSAEHRSIRRAGPSRRWIQLRDTTPRTSQPSGTGKTQDFPDSASDRAAAPEVYDRTATTCPPRQPEEACTRAPGNPDQADPYPVGESGQPVPSDRCADQLAPLLELSLLPAQMAAAATTAAWSAALDRRSSRSPRSNTEAHPDGRGSPAATS